MQTQPHVPDPASIWWGPMYRAAIRPAPPVIRPDARIGLAIGTFLMALLLPPLAVLGWWLARHELARIERLDCAPRGKGLLTVAEIGCALVTALVIAALVIAL